MIFNLGSIKTAFQSAKLSTVGFTKKLMAKYQSDPEEINIDIKFKHFQKLEYKRQEALANHILMSSSDDYVPANVRYRDQIYKVKLRLKGDWTNHLEGEKWSFRIKVKGNNTLFGMKQFSIQHPKTRNYVNEWFYHQTLKREGVLSLRYDFIKVILNGKDLGIYALEEHFEKRLVEHNRYREGPVLKFNENIHWADRKQHFYPKYPATPTGLESEFSSDIRPFKFNKTLEDPTLSEQFKIGNNLLEAFRRRKLPTHKVFDIEKLAKFFSVSELLGALHGAGIWHNMRFYYNPVTSLLEPIGFDGNAGRKISGLFGNRHDSADSEEFYSHFHTIAFSDTVFFKEYIDALERVSRPNYLKNLLVETGGELQEKLSVLHREFPFQRLAERNFIYNRQIIDKVLNPVKGLHAYFQSANDNEIVLEFGNIQSMPIEVLGLSFQNKPIFELKNRTILPPKHPSRPTNFENVRFAIPAQMAWSDAMISNLTVTYRLFGTDRTRKETVFPWSHLYENFLTTDLIRQKPNIQNFDFLNIDRNSKTISIAPASWTLTENLIVPENYTVLCSEGTEINLTNQATILSYSPLQFRGSEENPIKIYSADSSGQGIVVLNAEKTSSMEYVEFDNLSNPAKPGWKLTGAINFYESPVQISHCQFNSNRSEDGLNIIRSDFVIDNSIFRSTYSDAFDGDFVTGEITNSSFIDCGNDGIDVSGSVVDIHDVFMDGIGDKGVSIGENSQATLNQINIKNTEIAIASKDMSEISIENITLRDCKIGFTCFQKKPEFAAAEIHVVGSDITNLEIPFLVEESSKLTIDGKEIASSRKNIKEILYGVEYGKSSH
ncbi:hypothetical protein GWO43_15355 [candidate division KSB1 bacterium]|nr:hypothetical protein [candidate division KSB1 bacterium]NIR68367.1 hypothetical protein [candidate division KSB1 bacterium]NIS25311.1 hypothetical protein [candidate division KSB1 bacterium]NIT72222.1 hypothetical protein [candidate division KSB1 bacterium]NIU26030.1 hypothetical protein [candidate division KSB1 bacterium]